MRAGLRLVLRDQTLRRMLRNGCLRRRESYPSTVPPCFTSHDGLASIHSPGVVSRLGVEPGFEELHSGDLHLAA